PGAEFLEVSDDVGVVEIVVVVRDGATERRGDRVSDVRRERGSADELVDSGVSRSGDHHQEESELENRQRDVHRVAVAANFEKPPPRSLDPNLIGSTFPRTPELSVSLEKPYLSTRPSSRSSENAVKPPP